MINRVIGYILIALTVSASIAFCVVAVNSLFFPDQLRYVIFDRCGDLQIQDPVKLRGTTVGDVRNISLRSDGTVLVCFELDKPLKVYSGYAMRICDTLTDLRTADKGIFGDRIINIMPGDPTHPEIPFNDTLHGIYVSGVSEAIGSAWKLLDLIHSYNLILADFLAGTKTQEPFLTQYHKVIDGTESLSKNLLHGTHELDKGIKVALSTANKLDDSINSIDRKLGKTLPKFTGKTDSLLATLDTFIIETSSAEKSVNAALDSVKRSDIVSSDSSAIAIKAEMVSLKAGLDEMINEAAKLKLIITRWRY